MKKTAKFLVLFMMCIGLSSFGLHKFYVSIYQIDYVAEKKEIHITARIFIDDLNGALEQNFKTKIHVGEENESTQDVEYLRKYFANHFAIEVNNQKKDIQFLSKSLDGNVVICYFKLQNIKKINTLKISNSALIHWNSEQQNIIQTSIYKKKQSVLFKEEITSAVLKF